jgi:hypothetical protein
MSKKKHKSTPQRNLVAKYARDFNKSFSQLSKKDKQKHLSPKHKDKDD